MKKATIRPNIILSKQALPVALVGTAMDPAVVETKSVASAAC